MLLNQVLTVSQAAEKYFCFVYIILSIFRVISCWCCPFYRNSLSNLKRWGRENEAFSLKKIKTTDQEMKPSHRNKENAINHEVSSQIKSPYQMVKSKSTSALLPDEESTSKQIITVNYFSWYYGCTSSLGFGINVIWLIHITQKSFFSKLVQTLLCLFISLFIV